MKKVLHVMVYDERGEAFRIMFGLQKRVLQIIPHELGERACTFYGKVLGNEVHTQEVMGLQMGFLHNGQDGVGGAVVKGEGYNPSNNGALIYLNGGTDLSDPLNRVEAADGKVMVPKTKISDELGFMAVFLDSEGNRIAFHSPS